MKYSKLFLLCATVALGMSSCMTRIITTAVAPEPGTVVYQQPATRVVYGSTYVQHPVTTTTVVKSSPTKTTTTVVKVTPLGEDVSFFLDLRAVGAAFAESNSLEEFEMLLNSSTYMLSSLDLNRDGYVDYLRVVEAVNGYNHVIVIQAVLAQNIFQDVATLTAEMNYQTPYVQIIGSPYVYGPNYYVRPVFVRTPPIYTRWRAYNYNPWRSPYYWDYYPHYYHRPAPVYLSHYQAYVTTFLVNNKYCNHCEYDERVHYTDYSRSAQGLTRVDYETRHPEQSFSRRVSAAASSSGESRTASITNARDLQQRVAANTTTTTTSRSANTTSQGTSRTATTASSSSSSRGSNGSNSSSTSRSANSTSQGTSRTATTASSSSSSRGSNGSNSSSTSRSANTTSQGTSRTTTTTSGSSNTSSSKGTSHTRSVTPASTTTTSRVSTNGSSRTTSRTVNTDGSSSTTRRGASSTSTGTSRTASTTNSSTSSRTSTGSSRSSGTTNTRR